MSFSDPEVKKATQFYSACFHLESNYDRIGGEFAEALIGLIKGTAEIVKETSPETYERICAALVVLENK